MHKVIRSPSAAFTTVAPCLTASQTVIGHGGGVPVLDSWRSIAARS
jgi:hypothetical protein